MCTDVFIGYQGERRSRRIPISLSRFSDLLEKGYQIDLQAIRPGESTIYHPAFEMAENRLYWLPSAFDTEKCGKGKAQLVFTLTDSHGTITNSVKSIIYTTTIRRSVDSKQE